MGITEELLKSKKNVAPDSNGNMGITQELLLRRQAGLRPQVSPSENVGYDISMGGLLAQRNAANMEEKINRGLRENAVSPTQALEQMRGYTFSPAPSITLPTAQEMDAYDLQKTLKIADQKKEELDQQIAAQKAVQQKNNAGAAPAYAAISGTQQLRPAQISAPKSAAAGQDVKPVEQTDQEKAFAQASQRIWGLQREKDALSYIQDNAGKTYDDNFIGQFGASYTLGRLTQDESLAWNKYLDNPTEENRAYAEAIGQVISQFQLENQEVLADDATLPWVSQSLANYLPQFADQVKYGAVGAVSGGTVGSVIPVLGTAAGIKAGITAASGVYSYQTMRGAAFKTLLDLGVPEDVARAAANDEAVVSSAIEMADTGIDILTMGGKEVIAALTGGAAKTAAKKGAESAVKKFLKAMGKYGFNVAREWAEEATQQAVSIANAKRVETGEMNGIFDLAGDAAKVFGKALWDKEDKNRAEILEAGEQGTIVAGLMGPLEAGFNQLAYTGVTALDNKASADYGQQLRSQGLDTVTIEAGLKFDEGSRIRQMAEAMQQKQQNGQEVTDVELGDLYRQIKIGARQEYQNAVQQAQNETAVQQQEESGIMLPTADEMDAMLGVGSAESSLRQSGMEAGATEQAIESAERISTALGRDIQFFRQEAGERGTVNGFFDPNTGTIYVNSQSQNPVAQIIAHEMTHSVELADRYQELQSVVMDQLQKDGIDIDRRRQEIQALYERNGKPLKTQAEIDHEIVAQFVETRLLTDEQTILNLTKTNRSLMERVLDWINRTLQKLGVRKTTERDSLEKARDLYARALQESREQTKSEQAAQQQREVRDAVEYLRNALVSGEITESEYDEAMENVMEQASLAGVNLLDDRQYSISETLEEDLQKVLDGTFQEKANEVYIGETSNFMTDVIGADSLRVTMPSTKAYSAMVTEAQAKADGRYHTRTNYHGLGIDGLVKALNASENPVAAFAATRNEKGKRENRIVLVTEETWKDGNIVVVEEIETTGFMKGRKLEANKVITTYDRHAIANDIVQAALEGRLLYLDEKRSQPTLAGMPASNSQGAIRGVDFEKNIQDFWANVKWAQGKRDRYVSGESDSGKTAIEMAFEEARKKAESKTRYSISDGQERRNAETALEHFGETEKWAETGYLTVDGRRIDFSGRHWGGDGGYREVDHRDISEALGDAYGGEDYSGALIRFMEEGNIRVSPESNGVDLSVRPTVAQEKALRDYFDWANGAVTLDISSTEGTTITSVEYPEGTRADRIIKDIRRYFNSGEKPSVSETQRFRYSISETYVKEIENWDAEGRSDGKVFILGATGDVLQGLGAMEQDIYLRSEKINKILQEHPEMTLEEIKRIPEVLDDPVLVLKSQGAGARTENTRLVLFGTLRAKNGQPVLAVLDLRPIENMLAIDDMQKVNSAYTKDRGAANFVQRSEVLYADEKRTTPLLRLIGLTIASRRLLRSGSVGSIAYSNGTVNLHGIPLADVVQIENQSEDGERMRYSISDDQEIIETGITLPTAEDVMGAEPQEQTEAAEETVRRQENDAEKEQDPAERARAEGSGDIYTPREIPEEAASLQGYPVINGIQVVPLKTWVRDSEVGNYGLVTGLGDAKGANPNTLEILFTNKEKDKQAYAYVPIAQLELVPGEYQPTNAEINALMEAAPEEIPQEDREELYRYLTQRDEERSRRELPWRPIEIKDLNQKAQTYLERAERDMAANIGNSLSIPSKARRSILRESVREMTAEYLKTGRISNETKRRLFEKAYEAGIVQDREFLDQYKPLRDHLRNTTLRISKEDSADIPDFNDFRRRNFGRLNISTQGETNIDQVYKELSEVWPELFSEYRESTPSDQLLRIAEVAQNFRVKEKTLDEYYGPDAEEFKRLSYFEFEEAVYRDIQELQAAARYQRQKEIRQEQQLPKTVEEVTKLWEQLKAEKRKYEKIAAKSLLTDEDERLIGQLLRGEITELALDKDSHNVKGILAAYESKREYDRISKQLRAWNAERRNKLKELADHYLEDVRSWKDKKAGILYSRETMERNIRDIVPDEKLARRIINEYFTPVHKATADATRMKNQYRQRVKGMNLSRDVVEGNIVSESHAVQLLGEAEDNIRYLEKAKWVEKRDGKTLAQWREVVAKLWAENPKVDQKKIRDAVESFRKIYDELFQQMNEVRVRNGYEPINYRQGYFPHFQPGDGDGILAAFGRAMGISTDVTALPTSINGLTHTFKPGIQWFGNALERLGYNTEYDAVAGFDKYIEGAADVIYQTDNIQKLRQLSNQVRYRTTSEDIRKQVDAVLANANLSEIDKQNRIEDIYKNGKFELSNFVVELEEYTNLLANKKSQHDRSVESDAGRKYYNLAKWLEGRVAANMVSINPGSWITNLIPLTQGWAGVRNTDILRGMWDTLRGINRQDGMVERSTFLTNRRGSDPLVKAWEQGAMPEETIQRAIRQAGKVAGKVGDKLSSPMEVIDNFTSESLIRARYAQNLRKGLSEQNAMDEADAWVAGVMADRSKGAVPTLFMRKNPLTKLVTQFQLEVNNQLSYLFKDIPRETKQAGVKVLAWALVKFALGAWIYDELYERLIGRRPALDPFGILDDTVQDLTGWEIPELVFGALRGEMPEPEERTGLYEAATNLGTALLEQVPFTGALNMIGADLDTGRLPISNAFPDLGNLIRAVSERDIPANKRADLFLRELADSVGAYLIPPFGGGQLKKIMQTTEAVVRGGRYSVNNEGELQLQYPVYNDELSDVAGNAIWGGVFGPTSLPEGREWIERGFGTLSVDQTIAYEAMKEAGAEDETAFQVIQDYRAAEDNEAKREVIRNADINGDAKAALYYQLMASDTERQQLDILDDAGQDMGQIIDTLLDIKDMDAAAREDSETDEEKPLFNDKQIEVITAAGLEEDDAALAAVERESIWADRDLTTDEKRAEFSRWLSEQGYSSDEQHALYNAIIEGGKSESGVGKENRYTMLVNGGIDEDIAYAITSDISRLEPEKGENSVSREQKRAVVIERLADPEQQLAAMGTVNTEAQQQKFTIAYENGVTPEIYASVIAELPNYDEDGNGSLNQEEVKNALNSMGRGAFTLPGGENDFTLSRQEKAVIWQLYNKSWKSDNNPFGTGVGKRIYDALNPDEEE